MKHLKETAFADTGTVKEETVRMIQKEAYMRPTISVYEVDAEPFLAGSGKSNNIVKRNNNLIQAETQDAEDAYDYSKGTNEGDQSWDY